MPYGGKERFQDVLEDLGDYASDPVSVIHGHSPLGQLPLRYSLFSVEPDLIQFSGIKKEENGNGVVLRLFNPTSNGISIAVATAIRIRKVFLATLEEEIFQELEPEEKQVSLKLGPKKIKTLVFRF